MSTAGPRRTIAPLHGEMLPAASRSDQGRRVVERDRGMTQGIPPGMPAKAGGSSSDGIPPPCAPGGSVQPGASPTALSHGRLRPPWDRSGSPDRQGSRPRTAGGSVPTGPCRPSADPAPRPGSPARWRAHGRRARRRWWVFPRPRCSTRRSRCVVPSRPLVSGSGEFDHLGLARAGARRDHGRICAPHCSRMAEAGRCAGCGRTNVSREAGKGFHVKRAARSLHQ